MSSGFSDVVRTLRPNGPPETTRSSPSIRPDDLEFLDSLRSATPALERPRPRITGRPRASGNTPRPPLVSLISSLRSAISSASASAATLEATTPGSVTTTTASTRTFGPFINNTTTNVPNFPTGTASGTFFTLTTTPSSTSATPSTSNLPPPPPFSPTPSLPPPNASPSASLPPATIGGITAGVAAAFGLLLLAAFVLYRKRRDRLRPSYLEACEGGSTTLLPQTAPIAPILPRLTIHPAFRNAPISPIRDSPVSPLSPSSATAVVQPYFNPYYTALAQRNPYVFGPIPSSTARDEKRKRRKSLFLLKGWERTRLSGIPEGLEAEETGEDEGEWRKTLSESLGGFRFWESREDISHDWEGGDESEYSRRQSEVEDEGFEHVDF
ncbi:Hypothetical protein D9617_4g000690 [Elsinoe fawcettii]|nr:Hypothetical protein D9617_4g000690 [Elsinoe fawcettii]